MNRHSSRTSLFLIELMFSIFFFLLVVTVCLQLFTHAFTLSRKAKETTQALIWSQNLAEPFLGNMGDFSILKTLYSENDCSQNLFIKNDQALLLCFDGDWHSVTNLDPCEYVVFSASSKDAVYTYLDIYIAKRPQDFSLLSDSDTLAATLCKEEHYIYQLSVKKYIERTV